MTDRLPDPVDDFAAHYGHLPVTTARTDDILARYLTGDERSWAEEAADIDITEVVDLIRRHGRIVHPITLDIRDGRVVDGHHRLLAAAHLGLDTVPVRSVVWTTPERKTL